ncbi:MAG: hypothetical protein WC894_03470 [Patescibacteria group bacterium]
MLKKYFTYKGRSEVESVARIEDGQVIVLKVGEALIAVASISFMAVLGNRERLKTKLNTVGRLFGYGDEQISIKEAAKHKSKII